MGAYTVAATEVGVHKTLVGATVDTVTYTVKIREVEVINRSTTDDVYFTVDGTAPTVGGNNTYLVSAASQLTRNLRVPVRSLNAVVKVISAGAAPYSVIR